jgi:hypothetical protein
MNEVIKLAADHVDKYALSESQKAWADVQKEIHHEGCGCNSCKHNRVFEINTWLYFLSHGDLEREFQVQENGDIVEVPVNQFGNVKVFKTPDNL